METFSYQWRLCGFYPSFGGIFTSIGKQRVSLLHRAVYQQCVNHSFVYICTSVDCCIYLFTMQTQLCSMNKLWRPWSECGWGNNAWSAHYKYMNIMELWWLSLHLAAVCTEAMCRHSMVTYENWSILFVMREIRRKFVKMGNCTKYIIYFVCLCFVALYLNDCDTSFAEQNQHQFSYK